jgi:catechol 2,3-dioxygenase-like lactoylglutathione lyase family enzyme
MITGFNHFSFTVSDLDESVAFYEKIIGLEQISYSQRPQYYTEQVTGISGYYMKIAYLRGYGITLELIEYVGPQKRITHSTSDTIGSGHICFNVDSLPEMLETLNRHGVKVKSDPVEIVAGTNKGGLVVYASDPDGIVLELIQLPNP